LAASTSLSNAEAALRRIVSDLRGLGRQFALVGGLAVSDVIDVVPGFEVPIARLGHLIALKVLARDDRTRPQDRVDLAALLSRASATDLHEAREALTLVTRRGFHRGRNLLDGLDATINEFRA
jgi:hypothetical protein